MFVQAQRSQVEQRVSTSTPSALQGKARCPKSRSRSGASSAVTRGVASLCVAVMALMLLAGCARDGCGSGAETGEQAIRQLLVAATNGEPDDEVCRYLDEDASVAEAVAWIAEIEDRIEAAGGVDEVEIREQPSEQMGSGYLFILGPEEDPIAELWTSSLDDAFTVHIGSSEQL